SSPLAFHTYTPLPHLPVAVLSRSSCDPRSNRDGPDSPVAEQQGRPRHSGRRPLLPLQAGARGVPQGPPAVRRHRQPPSRRDQEALRRPDQEVTPWTSATASSLRAVKNSRSDSTMTGVGSW